MLQTNNLYEVGKVCIGDFELESGVHLKDVEVAYERVGNLYGDSIIVCHALTGNHLTVGTSESPGWWRDLIGPSRYIDTNKYNVITMNVLGGCSGSTGPTSINPETGKKYRGDFPTITIRDIVHSHKRALEKIGVTEVLSIIGGSLGGMQVLEWGILYPHFAKHLIPMAVTPTLSDYGIAFNTIGRHAIQNDPAWNNGFYEEQSIKGLEVARMVGLVTYRSQRLFNNRFQREKKNASQYQIDSYLKYQGEKFVKRFDANSYLCLLQAMDSFDIGFKRHGIEKALKNIESSLTMVAFSHDLLYPPTVIEETVLLLKRVGKVANYIYVQTDFGHDGFLVEFEKFGTEISLQLQTVLQTR
ncbi:homoserine O-acetyltransferase MetX [Sutcliffiella cohnii]